MSSITGAAASRSSKRYTGVRGSSQRLVDVMGSKDSLVMLAGRVTRGRTSQLRRPSLSVDSSAQARDWREICMRQRNGSSRLNAGRKNW